MQTINKFIIAFLFVISGIAAKAQEQHLAEIVPAGGGTFAQLDAKYLRDGYRSVVRLTERDSITLDRRKYGMLVYVKNTDSVYQLLSITLDNSNWRAFKFGSIDLSAYYTKVQLDSIISTITGINGVANFDGHSLGLGGSLNQNTYIDGSSYVFGFNASTNGRGGTNYNSNSAILYLNSGGALAQIGYNDGTGFNGYSLSNSSHAWLNGTNYVTSWNNSNGFMAWNSDLSKGIRIDNRGLNFILNNTNSYFNVNADSLRHSAFAGSDTTLYLKADVNGNVTNQKLWWNSIYGKPSVIITGDSGVKYVTPYYLGANYYNKSQTDSRYAQLSTDNQFTGKIGIGTLSSPLYYLHINKDVNSDVVAQIKNTNSGGFGLRVEAGSSSAQYITTLNDYLGNPKFIFYSDGGLKATGLATGKAAKQLYYDPVSKMVSVGDSTIGGGGSTTYTWVEQFDDRPSLGSNQVSGTNNTFTLTNTPVDSVQVYKNGVLQKNMIDYSISGSTITFNTKNYQLSIASTTTTLARTGGQYYVTVTTNVENFSNYDYVTVSGASPSSLNGTFPITSLLSAFTFNYLSSDTAAVVPSGSQNGTVTVGKYLNKKDIIQVVYRYSTPQSYNTSLAKYNRYNVAAYGNSLYYGSPENIGKSDVWTQVQKMVPTILFNISNVGTPSITTVGLNSSISTVLQPRLDFGYKQNIVFVMEGTNDINLNNANSYVAYTHLVQLCNNIKAITGSPKVIISTIMPFSVSSKDSIRTAVNSLIMANWATFADSVIDIASDPNFNSYSSVNNRAIYYKDGVHLTPEGYNIYAKKVYDVLMAFTGQTSNSNDKYIARILPADSIIKNGGNYLYSFEQGLNVGTKTGHPINFLSNNDVAASIDTTLTLSIKGAIHSNTSRAFGLDIIPTLPTISSGKRYSAAHIKPSFGSISDSASFLLIESQYGYNDVLDLKATADVDNNYKGYFYGRWYSNALNIPNDVTFTASTGGYMGGVTFGSITTGSPNNMFIGRNSNNLYYNVSSGQKHSLQIGNSSVLDVNSTSINAYQSIIPNSNSGANLGSTTNKFFNGYFSNTVYANGKIAGDSTAGANLTLTSTTSASKGNINLTANGYIKIDEVNNRLAIGNYSFSPYYPLHISQTGIGTLYFESTNDLMRFFLASGTGNDVLIRFYNGGSSIWDLKNQGSVADAFMVWNNTLGKQAIQVSKAGNRVTINGAEVTTDDFQVPYGTTYTKGLKAGYTAVTSTYTADSKLDYTIDCTSGTFTVTLPTAVSASGKIFVIKNSGNGSITVGTTSSQLIDGASTYTLGSQYKYVQVQSNGTGWIVVANN